MDHGRLRELEWQRDELWREMANMLLWLDEEGWQDLLARYEAACAELRRAL
jgi:hypothetical protein